MCPRTPSCSDNHASRVVRSTRLETEKQNQGFRPHFYRLLVKPRSRS
jgi:hypothetical protein